MAKSTKAPTQTASEAYAAKLRDVKGQLDLLSRVVENHSKQAITWGHVGDLAMMRERLEDLLSGFHPNLQ